MKTISSINVMVECEVEVTADGVMLRTTRDPTITAMTIHDKHIDAGEARQTLDRMIHALILQEVSKKIKMPEGTELEWVDRTPTKVGTN